MVLPLPLAPFEEYMLADDRPAYPMNFFIRLRFTGGFDRPALDGAVAVALSRHPLLTAIAHPFGRRWIWKSPDARPAVHWLDASPEECFPRLEPLDIRITPGVRVVACERLGRTDLIVQCHHACCDGMGIGRFIEDLLIAYAQARGAAPSSALRPLRPELLRGRGTFGLTAGKLLKMLPDQVAGLRGVRRFLMRTPIPLMPHQPQADGSSVAADYPASLARQLDRAEWTDLTETARRLEVSTNDLLMRDFFLALRDWRQQRVPDPGRGWLRLTMPINLRTLADRRLPAANVVSMVFLDRCTEDMKDPHRLLDSIHRQTQQIKRRQLGLTFVLSLRVCKWLPGGLHRMTHKKRCMASSVLTYLGPVLDRCPLPYEDGRVIIDGVVLESIEPLTPFRPLTSAAMNVLVYAERPHFTLHYDSRVLTEMDAAGLVDGFVARVRRSAASS